MYTHISRERERERDFKLYKTAVYCVSVYDVILYCYTISCEGDVVDECAIIIVIANNDTNTTGSNNSKIT